VDVKAPCEGELVEILVVSVGVGVVGVGVEDGLGIDEGEGESVVVDGEETLDIIEDCKLEITGETEDGADEDKLGKD
jgi:hypothetical protein